MRHVRAVLLVAIALTVGVGRAHALVAHVPGDSARLARDSMRVARIDADIDAPPVVPGAIATMAVHIPVVQRGARARFHIAAYAGVRVFGDTTGRLDPARDSTLLPITYSVGRTQLVGQMPIVRVTVDWPDGTRWVADVEASVRARFALRLTTAVLSVERTSATVRYTVTNAGNAPDTVHVTWDGFGWEVDPAERTQLLAPGAIINGIVQVRWDLRSAQPGEMHLINMYVQGGGGRTSSTANIRVPYTTEDAPGLMHAASNVFVGSGVDASGGISPLVALNASTVIGAGTDVSLRFSHASDPGALQTTGGAVQPRWASLRVHDAHFDATLGNLFHEASSLVGTLAQGSGGSFEWNDGAWRSAALAVGTGAQNGVGAAHTVYASTTRETAIGTIGGFGELVSQDSGFTNGGRVVTGGASYTLTAGADRHLTTQLGFMQVSSGDGSRVAAGLAADANYSDRFARGEIAARLHHVPAIIATGQVLPDNALVTGWYDVRPGVQALGSATSSDSHSLDGHDAGTKSLTTGVGFTPGGNNIQLTGTLYRATSTGSAPSTGQNVGVSLFAPLGALQLQASGQTGRLRLGDSLTATSQARAGARWASLTSWAWLGGTWLRAVDGSKSLSVDASGGYALPRGELEGGANLTPSTGSVNASLVSDAWLRVATRTKWGYEVLTGTEIVPAATGAARWRFSLGMRSELDLPLPIRQPVAASGVVYDDVNGDGVREANEPGVAGVVLNAADQHRQTTAEGRFSFVDPSVRHAQVSIDPASLPDGYIIPPTARNALAAHDMAIPVVRAGAITIVVHSGDSEADSAADPTTLPIEAPDGTMIVARDAAGRERLGDVSGGVATLTALVPGSYVVTITAPATTWRGPVERTLTLSLGAGARERRDLVLPRAHRTIRMGPAAPSQVPPTAGSAASASASATSDCGTSCTDTPDSASATRSTASAATPSSLKTNSATTAAPRSPVATVTTPPSGTKRPRASRTVTAPSSRAVTEVPTSRAKRALASTRTVHRTTAGDAAVAGSTVRDKLAIRISVGIRTAAFMGWIP